MDQQKTEIKNSIDYSHFNVANVEYVDIETGEITPNKYETKPVDLEKFFKAFKAPRSPNSATDNQTLNEYCLAIGEWASDKPTINFSLYKTALKKDAPVVLGLIEHIKYRNIVFLSIQKLCELFELKDNKNLDRKIKHLASRNIIQYEKVGRSNYKIVMNPKIFYRLGKGIGEKEAYNYMCHLHCWELDGTEEIILQEQQQQEKLEYVHYNFTPTPVTDEKELVWKNNDTESKMRTEKDCSYRSNRVLKSSHQKFIVDYCGL